MYSCLGTVKQSPWKPELTIPGGWGHMDVIGVQMECGWAVEQEVTGTLLAGDPNWDQRRKDPMDGKAATQESRTRQALEPPGIVSSGFHGLCLTVPRLLYVLAFYYYFLWIKSLPLTYLRYIFYLLLWFCAVLPQLVCQFLPHWSMSLGQQRPQLHFPHPIGPSSMCLDICFIPGKRDSFGRDNCFF